MNLRILLAVAITAGLLAGGLLLHGLTAGDPYSRLSVWADDAGHLHLDYRACGDELVTDVALLEGDPTAGHPAVLWRITSVGIPRTTFTIGQTPPGFAGQTPLGRLPRSTGEIAVELTTTTSTPGALVFTRDQLTPGVVLWDRGVEAATTYAARSNKSLGC